MAYHSQVHAWARYWNWMHLMKQGEFQQHDFLFLMKQNNFWLFQKNLSSASRMFCSRFYSVAFSNWTCERRHAGALCSKSIIAPNFMTRTGQIWTLSIDHLFHMLICTRFLEIYALISISISILACICFAHTPFPFQEFLAFPHRTQFVVQVNFGRHLMLAARLAYIGLKFSSVLFAICGSQYNFRIAAMFSPSGVPMTVSWEQ